MTPEIKKSVKAPLPLPDDTAENRLCVIICRPSATLLQGFADDFKHIR